MSRSKRRVIAQETLEIIEQGQYENKSQQLISINDDQKVAVSNTLNYKPNSFSKLIHDRNARMAQEAAEFDTIFEVNNETSLNAAKRLIQEEGYKDVLCLNFASARNPGGGFLNGSMAQEESLAISSGLYPCLLTQMEVYEYNRKRKTCLYSDHMIYSPKVPVFRDDRYHLLEESYNLSILTSAAVNAGVVERNQAHEAPNIEPTMISRTEKVLTVAYQNNYEVLILGAWGCGVFRNDPKDVARYFGDLLLKGGIFEGRFKKVVFAVLDNSAEERFVSPFEEVFG